ncbi:hypothetical protein Dsin_007655 [Dipteronia sinensis]|uniref:Uncharacterized protein n=1 Tax=Dipteronia sinensis TaxID=43782 RepID=A0AAE0B1I0_9ROSI|nr:hypothetical protein Dsin_007655 [Dipteronia sinensis]
MEALCAKTLSDPTAATINSPNSVMHGMGFQGRQELTVNRRLLILHNQDLKLLSKVTDKDANGLPGIPHLSTAQKKAAIHVSSGNSDSSRDQVEFALEKLSSSLQENSIMSDIALRSGACQLKQLVDVVRKIVVDLEHERQINNDDTEEDFAEQNMA